MIYTIMGVPVKIAAQCGEHKGIDMAVSDTLLQTEELSPGLVPFRSFRFRFTLKADDGLPEIEAAIQAAPIFILVGEDLEYAIRRATP